MALPSKCDVDQLVSGLVEAAGSYSDTADLDGHVARAQIISKAKDLIRAVVSPIMAPNYHGLNVSDAADHQYRCFFSKLAVQPIAVCCIIHATQCFLFWLLVQFTGGWQKSSGS